MKPNEAPALSTTGEAPDRKPATKKTVAIIGAESAPGLGLVRAILEDPKGEFAPRAIVRRLDSVESRLLKALGAEVSVADPRNEAALKRVLAGAYGAFYIQLSSEHPSPETKLATANAVAGAAKHTGLRHVIWATLEDPGQTFLEHHDVTPTFQNGRWISDGEGKTSPEQIFTQLAIPTTFLHTAWEATVAAGNWTEGIGKHAYALLRDQDSIGQTVSISAARLIRRPTPAPMPIQPSGSGPSLTTSSIITARKMTVPPTSASTTTTITVKSPTVPTTAASAATAGVAPAILPPVGPTPVQTASSPVKMRKIAIIGTVVAAGLVGLVVMRQVQSQKAAPAPDPIETARPAEAVPPPPVAVKPPEPPAAAPPVAAAPEAPPTPAEVAPPEEAPVANNDRGGGKRVAPAAKNNHKHPTSKAGPVATAPAAPQLAAAAAHPAVAPVKTESPPRVETPSEHAAPAEPPHPVVAVRAPAKTAAPAPAAPPPSVQRAPTPIAQQPGFVDPKAVAATVRSHAGEANACYERAVMEHPDLHGRLTIHAVVDPTGHVLSVSPTSGINDGARLQTCLVGAFKSWAFPRPAGGVNGNVTYSFSFESP